MSTLIPYRHNNHLSRPDAMSFMDDFFRPFFGMDNFHQHLQRGREG